MENQRKCEEGCPVYDDSSDETLTASRDHPVSATRATDNTPTSAPGGTSPSVPDKVPSSAPGEIPSSAPSGISPSAPGEVPSSAPGAVSPSAPGEVPLSAPGGISPSAPGQIPSSAPSGISPSEPGKVPSSAPSGLLPSAPGEVPSSAPSAVSPSAQGDISRSEPGKIPSSAPSGILPSAPGEVPSSAPSAVSPSAPGEVRLSARGGPSPSAHDGASQLSLHISPLKSSCSAFLANRTSSHDPANRSSEPGKASSFTPEETAPSEPDGTSPQASHKVSPLEHDKASSILPGKVSSAAPDKVSSLGPDKVSSLGPDKVSSFTPEEVPASTPHKGSPFGSKTSPFAPDKASSFTPEDAPASASHKGSPFGSKTSPFAPDKASALTPNASSKASRKPSPFTMSLSPDDEPLPEPIADPFSDPDNPKKIPFAEITNAAYQIKSSIFKTPCVRSHFHHFSPLEVYLKKEFMQYTGCFKERGARNALQAFTPEQRKKGVVAASAGNYGQAVAYHGGLLNIPSTVVMPVSSPLMKIQNCVTHGAHVVLKGANMYEAKLFAMKIAKDTGATFLSGYDHPDVIAGQGTVGLEILEQVPDVDAVVVPVGGASLIAGVSVAIKTMKPECKIIGVESSQCLGFTKALEAGHPVQVPVGPSLADGLAVPVIGFNAYATGAHLVDKMIQVDEHWIALSILRLLELEKCVVEGSGAVPVAAVLSGQLSEFSGKKVVLILTGGNIDSTILGRVIDRGLAADNRLVKFHVQVIDRPGGLQELCFLIGNLGVSIKDMYHERAWVQSDVFQVRVKAVCETRDEEHTQQLKQELQKKYENVNFFGS